MGEPRSEKRKRDGEPSSQPRKKVAFEGPPSTIKVSSILRAGDCPPLIITTPGIELPTSLPLHCYESQQPRSKGKSSGPGDGRELLLRSTDHPTLEYTAREEEPGTQHFLGIFDPKTGRLDLIEAKKMEMRARPRAEETTTQQEVTQEVPKTMMDRRTDLRQTFGTQKAKKAIRETTLNAVAPSQESGQEAAMKATLEAIGAVTSHMSTREQLQAAVDSGKPIPKANLEATAVEDVYDMDTLIGRDVFNLVPVREWQEKVRAGDSVETASRFVSARLNKLAADDSTMEQLRVLRYLELLIRFYRTTKAGRRDGGRQLLPRTELRQALSPAPEAVIENIRRKFSDGGSMRKFHMELLKTHCCVFALIVDGFQTITQQLREDLKVSDDKTMNQFYHEIGAKVKPFKIQGQSHPLQMATLTLPLKFPKQRQAARRPRR
ncbi:hypothetical protein XA68_10773 [Ophiocordyceps unilateralis]|uniref:DNA-directed RNA polymerase I subunit rpa49 n=1 Tax=Ophiocordyceps unilateralis TaxID=268505 RepID=A0A2A9PGV0_OPHUN|nr:hypothetical protein XA68_10773 [Ophiocordyceps unilateralis]